MSRNYKFWDKVFDKLDEKYTDEAAEKLSRHMPEQLNVTEIIVNRTETKKGRLKPVLGIAAAGIVVIGTAVILPYIKGGEEIPVEVVQEASSASCNRIEVHVLEENLVDYKSIVFKKDNAAELEQIEGFFETLVLTPPGDYYLQDMYTPKDAYDVEIYDDNKKIGKYRIFRVVYYGEDVYCCDVYGEGTEYKTYLIEKSDYEYFDLLISEKSNSELYEVIEFNKTYPIGNVEFGNISLTNSQYEINLYEENAHYYTQKEILDAFEALTGTTGIRNIGEAVLPDFKLDLNASYTKLSEGTEELPSNIALSYKDEDGREYIISASAYEKSLTEQEYGGKYTLAFDEDVAVSQFKAPDGGTVDVRFGGINYKGEEFEKGYYLKALWTDRNGMNYCVTSSRHTLQQFVDAVAAIIGDCDGAEDILSYYYELPTNPELYTDNMMTFSNGFCGKWKDTFCQVSSYNAEDELTVEFGFGKDPFSYYDNKLIGFYEKDGNYYMAAEKGLWFVPGKSSWNEDKVMYYYDVSIGDGETVYGDSYVKTYEKVESVIPTNIYETELGYIGVTGVFYGSDYTADDIYSLKFDYNGSTYMVNAKDYPIYQLNSNTKNISLLLPVSNILLSSPNITFLTADFIADGDSYTLSDKHYSYNPEILDIEKFHSPTIDYLMKQVEGTTDEDEIFKRIYTNAEFLPIEDISPNEAYVIRTSAVIGSQWASKRDIYYYPYVEDGGYEYVATLGCHMGTFRYATENGILYALNYEHIYNTEGSIDYEEKVSLYRIEKGRYSVYPVDIEKDAVFDDISVENGVVEIRIHYPYMSDDGGEENYRAVIDFNQPYPQFENLYYIPEPFPEAAYDADQLDGYRVLTNPLLSSIGIDANIDDDEFMNWVESMQSDGIKTDIGECVNMYTYIRDFNVDKETVRKELTELMNFWDEHNVRPNYTKEGIDILLSGDKNKIAEYYANDSAVYLDGNIYTPEWFYNHSIEDYLKLDFDMVEVAEKMANSMYYSPYTDEGRQYFANKISKYTGIDVLSLISEAENSPDHEIKVSLEMPLPFGGDMVADELLGEYYSPYVFEFRNIDSTFFELVGDDKMQEWADYCNSNSEYATVLLFIQYFGIEEEALYNALVTAESSEDYQENRIISSEDVELLYSGDTERINRRFANGYALIHGDKIYSAQWVYENPTEAYEAEGISFADLLDCVNRMMILKLSGEAQEAMLDKLARYKAIY